MKLNENINVMGMNAIVSYDDGIPGSRELAIASLVMQAAANITMPGCGAKVAGIEAMTATCTKTTGIVGETITLTATGSGGTAPYTIVFKNGATVLATFTGVTPGTAKTFAYILSAADVGTQVFTTIVTDANAKSCSESCTVTVSAAAPSCSFTVV